MEFEDEHIIHNRLYKQVFNLWITIKLGSIMAIFIVAIVGTVQILSGAEHTIMIQSLIIFSDVMAVLYLIWCWFSSTFLKEKK